MTDVPTMLRDGGLITDLIAEADEQLSPIDITLYPAFRRKRPLLWRLLRLLRISR